MTQQGQTQKKMRENPFFALMGRIGDLVILSLVFLACCVPIFTIGAACCAAMQVVRRLQGGDDGDVARVFWRELKANFARATPLWLLLLLAAVLLGADIFISREGTGAFYVLLTILTTIFCVLWLWFSGWVFSVLPLEPHEGLHAIASDAMNLGLAALPQTMVQCMLLLFPLIVFLAAITLFTYLIPFFVLFYPGFAFYWAAQLQHKALKAGGYALPEPEKEDL